MALAVLHVPHTGSFLSNQIKFRRQLYVSYSLDSGRAMHLSVSMGNSLALSISLPFCFLSLARCIFPSLPPFQTGNSPFCEHRLHLRGLVPAVVVREVVVSGDNEPVHADAKTREFRQHFDSTHVPNTTRCINRRRPVPHVIVSEIKVPGNVKTLFGDTQKDHTC